MKRLICVLAVLVLLTVTIRPAQAGGFVASGCVTPFYGCYSAPAYASSYCAPGAYYAPVPQVYYAPPRYYPPRVYYSPYYYAPPAVRFSFGYGAHGYHHHPYHRHGRW